jgi:hypothetical protein
MNKTEAAYAETLEARKLAGEIQLYQFEPVSWRIARGAWYKPDFMVMMADDTIEFHEVKGFWAEAAKVRIKVAAAKLPFRFIAVKKRAKKDGGGWEVTEF